MNEMTTGSIHPDGRWRSTFRVPAMDCPSEENLIRAALRGLRGARLTFDLPGRTLVVEHAGPAEAVLQRLQPLELGAQLVGSVALTEPGPAGAEADLAAEARVLRALLAINALMFVVELAVGWWAQSTGLMADALDMLADAAVYGTALLAVARGAASQAAAARVAGWTQGLLALLALVEVARRAWFGSEPVSLLMMGVGALALVANVACLLLIARHRDGGVHMQASYIFSANDVLANLGVIVAGALVLATGSPWPDLLIGTVIAVVVLRGARRILALT
ncbi:Zinc transporter ZitB [Tepidimonas sediminis]|uniref:Zinc transporter ZitB n=1 Tax=Tepidimonas sediminis TaxID=2588941 RepID=A0A554WSY7_9BURK|nr:cation transporter [Tepidimonas sediminis]TSE26687.1 Zinc transporter ZitB [Tepidimonas sediminis]